MAEIKGLESLTVELMARLDKVESKMEQGDGKIIEGIDDETTKLFEVQMVIEPLTIGVVGQGEEDLPKLADITTLPELSDHDNLGLLLKLLLRSSLLV